MADNFADRLLAAIDRKGSPVCVGIDPIHDRIPAALRDAAADPVDAIAAFCFGVLETVAAIVPAVKPQIAYFEIHGQRGVGLYFDVVRRARELGLIVIGDVKRGDIGSTAAAYAAAHLAPPGAPDAVTINGYFGADGIAPFVDAAAAIGRGAFVLVRTSNPSAADVQDFADAHGKRFYEHIAEHVAALGCAEGLVGRSGYSCLGAVVGATYPAEARRLRELMPRQIFLVPGYGAQGASAADCAAAFDSNSAGAIVNASRSVLYAHQAPGAAGDWRESVAAAATALADDIRSVL